ncbi:alkylation response protein AidB-like acyl-CoA dehydrogenase [Bradyrhizobium sp. CIR3A]|nr:alkylation response protein AidB-like acyl-CoA dehydrogenase [Bradyrhizobium sp. CIR3A]
MSVRPQAKDKPAAASFQWDNPFLLDEQLTEDERMVRDTARAYAQDKLLPRVTKAYLEEKTDREIFNEMGELGLIGSRCRRNMAAPMRAMSPMASSRSRSSGSIPAIAR